MSDPRIEALLAGRPPPPPTLEDENRRVPAKSVAAFHGICLRSLNRWLADPRLAYPKPAIVNGRRYWRVGDILAWDQARAGGADDRPRR
jgi:hypothetical protein